MHKTTQLTLLDKVETHAEDWTFSGASTRELTHCYHDYPARMIPQVAGKLLDIFATGEAKLLFDPYCGTGTSLVEGMIRGINVVGTDLNPLARLIAKAKTSTPQLDQIDDQITTFNRFVLKSKPRKLADLREIQGISRLEFWFKPNIIEKLLDLKHFVDAIKDTQVRLFFQVAFSETVRESSNTRNEEFKLYRYDSKRLEKFDPDVHEIMVGKLKRNRTGLQKFINIIENFRQRPTANVYGFNTVTEIPYTEISPASVDIVVTSPPYGDSHTTVAYGQYSRLSAAWLGLDEPEKTDAKLMGGKRRNKVTKFQCAPLDQALESICQLDEKRGMEVAAFYYDLSDSISHVAQLIKPGGYACYVVGNRKVKGVVLPTDTSIRCFFENHDFDYIDTFHRTIPNKRMPLRNSPTNASGVVDNTMTQEFIIVMRRRISRILREKAKSPKRGR